MSVLYYLSFLFLANGLVASYCFGKENEKYTQLGCKIWSVSFVYFIFYNILIHQYSEMLFFLFTLLMTIRTYYNSKKLTKK